MKLSNIYLAVGAVLSAVSFTSAANTCSLTSNEYPAHAQWSCSLEDWVSGHTLPTKRKTLSSSQTSVVLYPEGLELAGDLSVRQNRATFSVSKKLQNCSAVYESFNGQIGKFANVVTCESGPYQFEKATYYHRNAHCSVSGNIETCVSNNLVVTPFQADLNYKVPKAHYQGELKEVIKKNRISKNLGLVPIRVGDITTFIPAEVTNLSPFPPVVNHKWSGQFKSDVKPSTYYEMSCVENTTVPSVKIPLLYKDAQLSQIGVASDSGVGGFEPKVLDTFMKRCAASPVRFAVVNSQDLNEPYWRVNLDITGGTDYIGELEKLADVLVAEANGLIVERQSLNTLLRNSNDLNNQINTELSVIWDIIANSVYVSDFFTAGYVPAEFDVGGLEYILVSETALHDSVNSKPNFNKLRQLAQETGVEGIENLFNFDFDYLYDEWGYKKYETVHYAHWNFLVSLAQITGDISYSDNATTDLKPIIVNMKNANDKKVLALISVIEHTLNVARNASSIERDKIKALQAKLTQL
ncbi:hypothetical protein CW749_20065 [Vibrio sp. vnigr-6D03]|uniref:hypothetical protein n=1 Tax=Vibrio sp. vnigr-6D03 TaxID=2058088 RepID=UPI000C3248C3|nr:hypothetical protein [Vibrio sp. vnigr-6D03]PKF77836.1 hypothetical protein CW749_20065 [Vibrio sp. vnigr-6D03]